MNGPYDEWDAEEATPYPDGKPDSKIVPYVEALREQGVTTYGSCSGHPDEMWDDKYATAHLIIEPVALDFEPLREVGTISHVYREYLPNESWTIKFNGWWQSEACLRKEMAAIFESLGVELP